MKRLLVGTAKGLVIYRALENSNPEFESVHFAGFSINMLYCDERTHRWWIGVSHKHWGQKLHYSDDLGKHWFNTTIPTFKGETLPNGKTAKLRQIWCMAHGGSDKPNELWLGTDPGGLFHSADNGQSFQLVESLWNHPSRQKEGQWFGAGSDFPFIHSIIVNPTDSNHIYVAVSCAGIFESKDGGKSWHPKNKGLIAAYLPNPKVEVGHDPHLLLMSKEHPEILWQQNHCGVFYSNNEGGYWQEVSMYSGIPYYGFAIAIDDAEPAKAWVIPVESDEQRIAPNLSLQVYATHNYGATWESVSRGLPTKHTFDIVLRHSFVKAGDMLVFGTTNGNVYWTHQSYMKWKLLTNNLTKVNSVTVT